MAAQNVSHRNGRLQAIDGADFVTKYVAQTWRKCEQHNLDQLFFVHPYFHVQIELRYDYCVPSYIWCSMTLEPTCI